MRRSLNEIEVGLRKAAIGAGWSQGQADEIGRAGMVMCGLGGDGVGTVLELLDGEPDNLAVIIAGFDLLGAGVIPKARFSTVNPDLIAGFAHVAGQAQGCGFVVEGALVFKRGGLTKPTLSNGADVRDVDWQKVVALVQKTFVPASESSRLKGAGAGVTDND